MAYTPITTQEVTSGEPVSSTTQNKIKNNLADHETRLIAIESSSAASNEPMTFDVQGDYNYAGAAPQNGIMFIEIPFNCVITGIYLRIKKAGSSGTTQIDVQKSSNGTSWTSVLTTKPAVPSSAGDYKQSDGSNGSVAAVLNSANKSLLASNLIRLDISAMQAGQPDGFTVRIDYSRT